MCSTAVDASMLDTWLPSSPYSVMCGGIGGHCSKLFYVNEM